MNNEYKVSASRWGILASVIILNVANNLQFLSFAPVATATAAHFARDDPADVDWLTNAAFLTSAPTAIASTWAVQIMGLR